MNYAISQLQNSTNNNKRNVLKMTSSCIKDDVIICGGLIRDDFKITKVIFGNNILQHLDEFACCYKDLLVLMTSSLFA